MTVTDPLVAYQAAEFDWVSRLSDVWGGLTCDVDAIHGIQRAELGGMVADLVQEERDRPRLVLPIVGEAGSGKTHLMSYLRQQVWHHKAFFIFVDCTDIRDFWPLTVLSCKTALLRRTTNGQTQLETLLRGLVRRAHPGWRGILAKLARPGSERLAVISRLCPHDVARANTLNALFALNSEDFEAGSLAETWLLGESLERDEYKSLGLLAPRQEPRTTFTSISWALGQVAPTVLAFDQLDAIVTQHNLAAGDPNNPLRSDEQKAASAIIEGIMGGLSALYDCATRTQTVITCLSSTWLTLKERSLFTNRDRFLPQVMLPSVTSIDAARQLVSARLRPAYDRFGFRPEYPAWPFSNDFLTSVQNQTPRRMLKYCHDHQLRCGSLGHVTEAEPVGETPGKANIDIPRPEPTLGPLERKLEELRKKSPIAWLSDEKQERELGKLIERACAIFLVENPGTDTVDHVQDASFADAQSDPPLHTRLRRVFRTENDREEHWSVRVLARTNATAFQARLRAALTQSGLDRKLAFRKLFVLRNAAVPNGRVTAALRESTVNAGGRFEPLPESDFRTLWATVELQKTKDPEFSKWVHSTRPLSNLGFFRNLFAEFLPAPSVETRAEPPAIAPATLVTSVSLGANGASTSPKVATTVDPHPSRSGLFLGLRIEGGREAQGLELAISALTHHVLIRAGSGGGKTVLVKRMVEEAALQGIPSIVLDAANDLSQLHDDWPSAPPAWLPGDAEKAARFRRDVDVKIFTPNLIAGRPISFDPLPDLASLASDPDEFNIGIELARNTLEPIVAQGKSKAAHNKQGVLAAALRTFAAAGRTLPELVEYLADLPDEASGGIDGAKHFATDMANALRAAMQIDPQLAMKTDAADPASLFGLGQSKTRVSVINFSGLPSLEAQQRFVNRLAMALFTWIKRNPSVGPKGISGLFVIDEAKDYLPQYGSFCSASLLRLAAQARHYGLGLVVATQNPMDLDYKFPANCSTQMFGRANAPQVIDFIEKAIREKGGQANDICKLAKGQFYAFSSESFAGVQRFKAPMCLTYHPDGRPLTQREIIERCSSASQTRETVLTA